MLASLDTALLVQSAQVGSAESFTLLVEQYEREIYWYLVRMLGDREEAHDFSQQVFLKAWLNLASFKNVACFKVWLYTIARNLMFDYWRKKKLSCQSWEELVEDTVDRSVADPERHVVETESLQLALADLAPNVRLCLVLRVVDGYYPCEIARIVGINETSVSTYISTARKQLHGIFDRQNEEVERQERVEK